MGRVSGLMAAAMLAVAAWSAQAGNAERGKLLAATWCSACHVISTSGERAQDGVPPFRTIAAIRNRTPDYLRGWLQTDHARMPNFNLKTRDIEDLVSYIRSLADRK